MEQRRRLEESLVSLGLGRGLSMLLLFLLCSSSAMSQPEAGRWMLGVFGGPSMMLSDFNKKKFGWGVGYFPQYGLSQNFSVGLLAGYNALKTEQNPPLKSPPYPYMKVHAIPLTLVGSWHFTSSRTLSPFIYVGFGMVLAVRRDGLGNYISERHVQAYALFPVGAGLEYFLNKNLSLGLDLGVRILGNDNVEGLSRGLPDAYMLGRIGVTLYNLKAD